ncbi:hypothetical protein E2562_034177 [Oryza meyeriana var. granulata]|uniref:Uncharacterized protein n=1 Tax=Oryza meyeriana var. granulata TaxID=110450 RepID=A0A6G1ESA5_9ORYZ|nr:hypothetical protein E2562_034177 [Oryza meyeriana var. granulata]
MEVGSREINDDHVLVTMKVAAEAAAIEEPRAEALSKEPKPAKEAHGRIGWQALVQHTEGSRGKLSRPRGAGWPSGSSCTWRRAAGRVGVWPRQRPSSRRKAEQAKQ